MSVLCCIQKRQAQASNAQVTSVSLNLVLRHICTATTLKSCTVSFVCIAGYVDGNVCNIVTGSDSLC